MEYPSAGHGIKEEESGKPQDDNQCLGYRNCTPEVETAYLL